MGPFLLLSIMNDPDLVPFSRAWSRRAANEEPHREDPAGLGEERDTGALRLAEEAVHHVRCFLAGAAITLV